MKEEEWMKKFSEITGAKFVDVTQEIERQDDIQENTDSMEEKLGEIIGEKI